MRRRRLLAGMLATTAGLAACRGRSAAVSGDRAALTLVAYSTAKPLYAQLIPAFQAQWAAQTGQSVFIRESYGPSGAQSRACLAGLPADILSQNLQSNLFPLVERGLVAADWDQRLPNGASPAATAIVLVVRPGNPKNIQDWPDLIRDDIDLVAINPRTSGNARWGIMAGYGALLKSDGPAAAQTFLNQLVRNAKVLVSNGREATDTFIKNQLGDVLITFENEIFFTNQVMPEAYPYVVPRTNLRVDFPVTVIDKNVDRHGTRAIATAFTEFLFTPPAQDIFVAQGYRPLDPQITPMPASTFPPIDQLYTIEDFGGWATVNAQLFSDDGLFAQAEAARRR